MGGDQKCNKKVPHNAGLTRCTIPSGVVRSCCPGNVYPTSSPRVPAIRRKNGYQILPQGIFSRDNFLKWDSYHAPRIVVQVIVPKIRQNKNYKNLLCFVLRDAKFLTQNFDHQWQSDHEIVFHAEIYGSRLYANSLNYCIAKTLHS